MFKVSHDKINKQTNLEERRKKRKRSNKGKERGQGDHYDTGKVITRHRGERLTSLWIAREQQ